MPLNQVTLCSEEFFPFFPNHSVTKRPPPDALFPLFTQWERTLQKLVPVLQGRSPTIFVSHAWHETYYRAQKDVTEEQIKEAIYYDYFDLILTKLLKEAGFEVFYDKDLSNNTGIMDQGATPFMKSKVMSADIILAICTPLYKERSIIPGTGVYIEVECIKERFMKSPTISFFIPILIHASNPDFPVNNLLVGQDLDRMKQVIYLNLRDATTFISNIWRVLHRLWKNTKAKWELSLDGEDALQIEQFLQQYVAVLGDLLQYEDYYDCAKHLPVASSNKEIMKNDFYSLRILTTLTEDIKPDVVLKLLRNEMISHRELFSVSKNQDIVAVLGNTGVGKSTMINFLSGKSLQADQFQQSYELVDKQDKNAFKIGSSIESETIYPQCVKIGMVLYFDLPGFMDSNGSIRDLINAAFIYQIIAFARSVRFLFLIGQDEITAQRGKIMKRLFSSIEHAFKDEKTILESSMLIVTKSNFQFHKLDLLVGFLHAKLSTSVGITLREQLEKWEQTHHIQHIPHPSFDDISHQEKIREDLLNGIERVIPMENNKIGLTDQFNLSGFYPPEVSLPLLNMFSFLIQQECAEYESKDIRDLLAPLLQMNEYSSGLTQKEFLDKLTLHHKELMKNQVVAKDLYSSAILDELPESIANLVTPKWKENKGRAEDLIKEYLKRIDSVNTSLRNYSNDSYWMDTIWKKFEKRIHKQEELKLLTDIARDTYEQAKGIFVKKQQEEVITQHKRIAPQVINAFFSSKSLMRKLIEEETAEFPTKVIQNCLNQKIEDSPVFPSKAILTMTKPREFIPKFEQSIAKWRQSYELIEKQLEEYQSLDYWRKKVWDDFDRRFFAKYQQLKEFLPITLFQDLKGEYQQSYQEKAKEFNSALAIKYSQMKSSETECNRWKEQFFKPWGDSFDRFINGKLIYSSSSSSSTKQELSIPLDSIEESDDPFHRRFDLSKYQDDQFPNNDQFIFVTSFETLMKLRKSSSMMMKETMQVVLIPKFLFDSSLSQFTSPGHVSMIDVYGSIPAGKRQSWGHDSDVAIFFFYRVNNIQKEEDLMDNFRYTLQESMQSLSSKDLYSIWKSSAIIDKQQELTNEKQALIALELNKDRLKKKAEETTTMIFLGPCILSAFMLQASLDTCGYYCCCDDPGCCVETYDSCLTWDAFANIGGPEKCMHAYKSTCPVFKLNKETSKELGNCSKKYSSVLQQASICINYPQYYDFKTDKCPACIDYEYCFLCHLACYPLTNFAWFYRNCIRCCAKHYCIPCWIREYERRLKNLSRVQPEDFESNHLPETISSQLSRFRFSMSAN